MSIASIAKITLQDCIKYQIILPFVWKRSNGKIFVCCMDGVLIIGLGYTRYISNSYYEEQYIKTL